MTIHAELFPGIHATLHVVKGIEATVCYFKISVYFKYHASAILTYVPKRYSNQHIVVNYNCNQWING